jgi:hypothetical protein
MDATSQLTSDKIRVGHYTEVLSFPIHFTQASAFSVEALSLRIVSDAISGCVNGAGVPYWQEVKAGELRSVDLAGSALSTNWARAQHATALAYFHPAVRRFLFGSRTVAKSVKGVSNDYLGWYRRDEFNELDVYLSDNPTEETPARFQIVRHDLILFQPDVGVMQIELCAKLDDAWTLSRLQNVRDRLRRIYAPYLFTRDGSTVTTFPGRLPTKLVLRRKDGVCEITEVAVDGLPSTGFVGEAYSGAGTSGAEVPENVERLSVSHFWTKLLAPLDKLPGIWALPPGDDRLPSMAFIALNNFHAVSPGDWVRLTYADGSGNDELPYAREFVEANHARCVYDRFFYKSKESSDCPSRILNCGYAFTMVGCSGDTGFFMEPHSGSFATFRQIYVRMGLVAHFQKTALLGATARLSSLARRLSETGDLDDYAKDGKQIKAFYEHFIEFTQVYWFDEVSPQEQGVQLFEMWQRALRSKELYAEVRQEVKDLVDYVNLKENEKQSITMETLTRSAGALGALGVFAGLMGMNNLPYKDGQLLPNIEWPRNLLAYVIPGIALSLVFIVWLLTKMPPTRRWRWFCSPFKKLWWLCCSFLSKEK